MNREFEDFLSAPIGEQTNGMPVSVFSALARLDIDPWREARRLSDMPRERAIQALCDSIDALADLRWLKIDAGRTAAGVIHLLPNHGKKIKSWSMDDEVVPPRGAAQPSLSAGLMHQASSLPAAAWLAIGVVVLVTIYMFWSGGESPQSQGPAFTPLFHETPVREQQRR